MSDEFDRPQDDIDRDELELPLEIESPEPLLPLASDDAAERYPFESADDTVAETDAESHTVAAEGDASDAADAGVVDAGDVGDVDDVDLDLEEADALPPLEEDPELIPVGAEVPEMGDDLDVAELTPPAENAEALAAGTDTAAAAEQPPAGESPMLAEGEPRDMDLGPEKRMGVWVWGVVAAVIVIAAAVAGILYYRSVTAPVAVPGVTGKGSAQATQSLNDAGLRLGEVSTVPTSSAPAGTVVDQKPKAGESVKRDSTVSLVVATSPEMATVPDLSGRTREDAESTLAAEQLRAVVVESYSTTIAAGQVISQLPSATIELPPGSAVALAVSTGPQPASVGVPNLSGVSENLALRILDALDLVGVPYRSLTASSAAGEIVAQSVKAGAAVPVGTTVQFLVSSGKGNVPVAVPTVTGRKQVEAEATLKRAGLVVDARSVADARVPVGQVISQMPAAGAKTARGTTVGLLVSKGNVQGFSVPDVNGKASLEASGAIGALGFKPFLIGVPSKLTANTIWGQFPAAGTSWPARFPVIAIYATPVK